MGDNNIMIITHEIPNKFYDEETRNGYYISEKTKKIWIVELDLLSEFMRVCKKYNILYYAESGTLLGAVRHGGFIPWDDDIDVIMMRPDYEKLCKVANKEFSFPYFFQTEYTDPRSARGHAQLRNSSTTGILLIEKDKKCTFNQGFFLDIFVMDVLAPANERQEWFDQIRELKEKAYNYTNETCSDDDYNNIYYYQMEQLCQKYNNRDDLMKCGTVAYSIDRRDMHRRRMDYKDIIYLDFEFLKIPAPQNYASVLQAAYGVWTKTIKRTASSYGHGGVFFDTEKAYTEYV